MGLLPESPKVPGKIVAIMLAFTFVMIALIFLAEVYPNSFIAIFFGGRRYVITIPLITWLVYRWDRRRQRRRLEEQKKPK